MMLVDFSGTQEQFLVLTLILPRLDIGLEPGLLAYICVDWQWRTKMCFIYVTAKIRTTAAPPITYPLNLGGGGGKVGTLNITWDAMPEEELRADRTAGGYIVSWKKAEMEDDQWDHVCALTF